MPEPPGPKGPVEQLVFGGILEWRGGDSDQLGEIVASMNRLGLAPAELDADGGRYSLLFDDAPVPGNRVWPEWLEELASHLQELIDATDDPALAESTLHCSAFHADDVVETLIGIDGGRLRPISRVSSRRRDETRVVVRRFDWKTLVPLALLLIVGFSLMAWRSGYLDRIFATSASELALETASFEGRLSVAVERNWGQYEITITRGPAYPNSLQELAEQREKATSIADRAAIDILGAGGTIYVRLLDDEGNILASASTELRPLVEARDGRAIVKLHGHIGAARIRLALSKGTPP